MKARGKGLLDVQSARELSGLILERMAPHYWNTYMDGEVHQIRRFGNPKSLEGYTLVETHKAWVNLSRELLEFNSRNWNNPGGKLLGSQLDIESVNRVITRILESVNPQCPDSLREVSEELVLTLRQLLEELLREVRLPPDFQFFQ